MTKVSFTNFDPEILAGFMISKDYKGCWDYVVDLIEGFSIQKNKKLGMAMQRGTDNELFKEHLESFSILAGELLFSLLSDPAVKIPDASFYRLIGNHEVIHNFFHVKGIGDTDRIVSDMVKGKKKLSPMEQKRLILLLSVNTDLDIIEMIKKTSVRYQMLAVNAYISHRQVYRKNVHNNKITLIKKMGYLLDNILVGVPKDAYNTLIASLLGCYFSCSYLDYDEKHEIKKHANESIMRLLRKLVDAYLKGKNSSTETQNPDIFVKPKLLVILENYGPNHAMERCYDSWLVAYQEVFDVTVCITREFVFPAMMRRHKVLHHSTLPEFLDILYKEPYDMVLFPSVGMSYWGILASNLRVAPVQAMFLGHPATSKSSCIDFVYGPEEVYDERAFPTDRFIAGQARYQFSNILSRKQIEEVPIQSYDPDKPRPLRVSIVGSAAKIAYPFLKMLQEIEAESDFEIEFIFHLNSTGMDAYTFREHLKTQFKNLTMYGYQRYDIFLESIGKTDIVLNPFPFGHTNTIIDTLLLGKPCVSYYGIEPASRTERYVLSLVGLVEKFEVTNQQEYKQKFQELAAEILKGNTEFYDRAPIYDALIEFQEEGVTAHDPAQELRWLYDHADEIKESGKKFFEVPEEML